MGRYYSGDIDGKFWFAVQSSDAADRFGVSGDTPNYLEYYFSSDDLKGVQLELKKIEKSITPKNIKIFEDFFNNLNGTGYNDDIMETAGVLKLWNKHKTNYADLILGKKIEKCLIEEDECSFTAEN